VIKFPSVLGHFLLSIYGSCKNALLHFVIPAAYMYTTQHQADIQIYLITYLLNGAESFLKY